MISVGDQQSCQQPGSCTKGVMVSRLRSQATGDSTSKPALTSKRPVNFPCRIFSLSSFFFFHLHTFARPLLRGVSTLLSPSTALRKPKGRTPVSTLSSDLAHQGQHEERLFPLDFYRRPPNFLSSCAQRLVSDRSFDCWFPNGPPGSQILACLRRIRTLRPPCVT